MATARFGAMGSPRPTLKTETFDMDSFFDFNQAQTHPSPSTASSSRADATPKTPNFSGRGFNGTLSPFDQSGEQQVFAGPSHEYDRFKQQTGLPVGSIANMQAMSSNIDMFDGYSSGNGDVGFNSGFNDSWSSGIDIDGDMGMDFNNLSQPMPAMFFPPGTDNQNTTFVDPNAVGGQEEPASSVGRLWPGMHQQQAMQKQAQAQMMQQRQTKMQAQQEHLRQAANGSQPPPQQPQHSQPQGHSAGKRPSHVTEPLVEESISRLLNQMRQNSNAGSDEGSSPSGSLLPHIARMRKEEEEMDDDERLLASDEGKKLSSKERRQLRNKVSARAFRSRRKEYIGQLEGEVAVKVQENNNLRTENGALLEENERYRTLIETLLRHPAFTPFIDDISKNPANLNVPQVQQQQHQQSVTPTPTNSQPQQQQQVEDTKPAYMDFDASQLQIPQHHSQNEQVGMATIPEEKMDFSRLNIGSSYNFNSFQSVNAYAVTELPTGPDPVELLAADSRVTLVARDTGCFSSFSSRSDAFEASTNDSFCGEPNFSVLIAKLGNSARRMKASENIPPN